MKKTMKLLTVVCCVLLFFFSNVCNARRSVQLHQSTDLEKQFVLVHGASHGAWCWYKIIALIKSAGHTVTAIDLASSGIDPKQALDVPTISQYFKPLMDFMDNTSNKVVLVGHSYGGLAISQAMEKFPNKISAAVFIAAAMPGPAFNISTYNKEYHGAQLPQLDSRFTYDNGPDNPPTTFIHGPMYLAAYLYQLSPPEDFELATTLVRPLYCYTNEDLSKEIILSEKNYGSVNRVFIITNEDKIFTRDNQEWLIGKNPPDEVKVIEGSDHMAMISKPAQLSALLIDIAQKYYSV